MTGTIKNLTGKGFGFIAHEGETKDIFFHSNDLNGVSYDELKVGDAVTFDIEEGQKDLATKNVTKV